MEEQIIYPKKIIKYSGSIYKRNTKWRVVIRTNDYIFNATVETKKEAKKLLKEKNIEKNLPIKNIIHDFGDYLEVELTQGKRVKFDREDLPIIEKYNWHTQTNKEKINFFYVANGSGKNHIYFHNIIMNHTPGKLTVDHKNRDGLDNRKENLRIVTKQVQCINQKIKKSNTSGTTGVYIKNNKGKKYYTAFWKDVSKKQKEKQFSINKYGEAKAKRLAIKYRKKMEKELEHYAEALDI
jgi:hypothetical protein